MAGGGVRVLVACEFSGVVRDAFAALGHDAWSCDLLPSDRPGNHIQGDVRQYARKAQGWDLMIAFPPCTHLAVSGARWFPAKQASGEQQEALDFVRWCINGPAKRVAIENPIGIISTQIRRPTQIIQPWWFGHREVKATCLWLYGGLPTLKPTNIVGPPPKNVEEKKSWERVHRMPPGPDRWKERSRTFQGIADAMAEQWGNIARTYLPEETRESK